jgi:hypothetical protein
MALSRKEIFMKSWWWSLVGSAGLALVFWFTANLIRFFQGNLVRFTDAILCASLVGGVLGASLIAWRVADKYYHVRLHQSMKRYFRLSLISLVIAIGLLFTPASLLVGAWSLVSAWCVTLALEGSKASKK